MKRKSWVWSIGSLCVLAVSFLCCRFALFDVHGMKQWPVALAIFGAIIIVVSLALKMRATTLAAALGYSVGFVAGAVFHMNSFDQGGGSTSNFWRIWLVVYLICMLAGMVFDGVKKIFDKRAR